MRLPQFTADASLNPSHGFGFGAPTWAPSGIQFQDCGIIQRLTCGVVTAAAATACAVTAGEGCQPALTLVKKSGCCDCLNNSFLRSLCSTI